MFNRKEDKTTSPEKPVSNEKKDAPLDSGFSERSIRTPSKVQTPSIPTKAIHVPDEFKDPLYCERMAYKIADASFAQTLACLQNEPPETWTNFHKLETPLRKAVQTYLDPDCTVDFKFQSNSGNPIYHGKTSKMEDRFEEQVRVSSIAIEGNIPRTPEQIQSFYGTYYHEIRHMIQCFAEGPEASIKKHLSKPREPYHQEYKKLEGPYCNGRWAQVYVKLGKDYPECKELNDLFVKHDRRAKLSVEQFNRFLKAMNKLWQKPGYPAIEDIDRFAIWKELFQKGEPKVVDYLVNHDVLLELEGYATFMKRAPNSPKVGYGNDLMDSAHFVFLRDLLRLYYDERQTPQAERHPYTLPEYAQQNPLKLFN